MGHGFVEDGLLKCLCLFLERYEYISRNKPHSIPQLMFSELLSDWIDSAGVFGVGLDSEVRGSWIPVVS